jgi:hypothetical protein
MLRANNGMANHGDRAGEAVAGAASASSSIERNSIGLQQLWRKAVPKYKLSGRQAGGLGGNNQKQKPPGTSPGGPPAHAQRPYRPFKNSE